MLAVVVGALALPGTAGAAYSDPLTTTTKQNLVWHATPAAALTALDNALPNVSLNTVVNDPSYAMTGCTGAEKAALPKAPAATKSLCWDADRAGSTTWVPQGITTSGDADDDGLWGADKIILSGWHSTDALGRYDDARIQAVNYDTPASAAHRMVYLAVPNSTGSTFSAAKAHMGGMAWYGDKIYVTAVGNTSTAIRVFSTKHILQLTDTTSNAIGRTSGGYAAYTYKYAMMQVGYYTYAGGTCSMAADTGVPCFSSISLDRSTSPATVVTTEYFSDQSLHGRLLPLPDGDGLPADLDRDGGVPQLGGQHAGRPVPRRQVVRRPQLGHDQRPALDPDDDAEHVGHVWLHRCLLGRPPGGADVRLVDGPGLVPVGVVDGGLHRAGPDVRAVGVRGAAVVAGGLSQRSSRAVPSAVTRYRTWRPERSRSTNPLSRSTPRCWETALGVTPRARARSVVVAGERSASRSPARARPSSRTVLPGGGRVPAVQIAPRPRAG